MNNISLIVFGIIILVFAASVTIPAEATVCNDSLDDLLSKNTLVTITITDKENGTHRFGWGQFTYDIDEIKYLSTAKSNILEKNNISAMLSGSLLHQLEIGEQYLIPYVKNDKDGWFASISSCNSSIYHPNLLDYLEYLEEVEVKEYTSYYGLIEKFKLRFTSNFNNPVTNIGLNDKTFIGLLNDVAIIDKDSSGKSIIPKKILSFDVLHNYYNTQKNLDIVLDYPEFKYNDLMENQK